MFAPDTYLPLYTYTICRYVVLTQLLVSPWASQHTACNVNFCLVVPNSNNSFSLNSLFFCVFEKLVLLHFSDFCRVITLLRVCRFTVSPLLSCFYSPISSLMSSCYYICTGVFSAVSGLAESFLISEYYPTWSFQPNFLCHSTRDLCFNRY